MTCQRQPALGCVYKLVEINGQARIKLSQDVEKVTMPGNKAAYRLYGKQGDPLNDLLQRSSEPPPEVGTKVLCRHPFDEKKRAYVTPTRVESLLKVINSNRIYKRYLLNKPQINCSVYCSTFINCLLNNLDLLERWKIVSTGDYT